ncbi:MULTISPECIES: H-NS histone family protein [Xanthomonas translucens group]|uniref:Histone-like nucleoid-structuring protein n=1 Tax=Xanthomonas cerealis pv. cerealis TaxID=152263 RepID=A0A514EDF8_9XANT|nr:H-NS family nucleoid-associated regulatory protein [Xanthomonas translucens]QDI04031.1 histone-like nucleoid-structuring protein [Xanthomonas translucens pv. cerealis]UKE46009.1 H-NS histone family protein [Xanthomonas translucens pv. cerealis]
MTEVRNLQQIAEAKAKLHEEIRKLEEQEKQAREGETSAAHANILSLLEQFAEFFSAKQRNEIAAYVTSAAPKPASAKSSGGRSEVKPKYQLPHTGETWSGRGRTPKAFAAWEGTAAYNEWKARNPDLKFPLVKY